MLSPGASDFMQQRNNVPPGFSRAGSGGRKKRMLLFERFDKPIGDRAVSQGDKQKQCLADHDPSGPLVRIRCRSQYGADDKKQKD